MAEAFICGRRRNSLSSLDLFVSGHGQENWTVKGNASIGETLHAYNVAQGISNSGFSTKNKNISFANISAVQFIARSYSSEGGDPFSTGLIAIYENVGTGNMVAHQFLKQLDSSDFIAYTLDTSTLTSNNGYYIEITINSGMETQHASVIDVSRVSLIPA